MLEIKSKKILSHKYCLFRLSQDLKVSRKTEIYSPVTDQTIAKRVKSRDPDIGEAVWNKLIDSVLHLRRRLFGKCQSQDLGGFGPSLLDDICYFASDDRGFSCSCAGNYQKRASFVCYSFFLLTVESIQYILFRSLPEIQSLLHEIIIAN